MNKVRFGIIGVGTMGTGHARSIAGDTGRLIELGAVCDIDEDRARSVGGECDVPYFTDAGELYDSDLCDAVIIATPHYPHAPLALQAARAGLHVLCEKPLSSSVSHARAMIAECRKRHKVLGAVLHHRTRGIMQKARKLVTDGVLGEVFRVQMICSGWFRTQAYYDSGAWRGTWDGEGGGVLINQAPHHLDLFQWIGMGLPRRVIATCHTREHDIEVEDTANILCDYGEGRMGYIYATTAEQPGMEQFVLSGDKATMIIQDNRIRLGKLKVPIRDFIYGCQTANAVASPTMKQGCTWREVRYRRNPKTDGKHIEMVRGFAREVLGRGEQYAPGDEAINELELSNAAYLSGFTGGEPVDVPVDAAKMDRLLAKLERERSTGKGGGLRRKYHRQFRRLTRQ
ncbi:MAG: Gfo/Idh/MocA family protein [Planctomycetota bacterium]